MFSSERAKLTLITKIEANVEGNLAQYVDFFYLCSFKKIFYLFLPLFKRDSTYFVKRGNLKLNIIRM